MNTEELKKSDFLDQIKKVLSREIKSCEVKDIEGTMDEVTNWLKNELGEKINELFFLSAQRNKKDWPDQKSENIISFLTVTRQENKHNI